MRHAPPPPGDDPPSAGRLQRSMDALDGHPPTRWTISDLPEFLVGSAYKDPLFHGSFARGLTSLRPDMGREYGIFMSPRRAYAARHGPVVYKAYANFKRPLVVRDKSEISPRDLTREDAERLARAGYDSIVSGDHEVVLFRSDQLLLV